MQSYYCLKMLSRLQNKATEIKKQQTTSSLTFLNFCLHSNRFQHPKSLFKAKNGPFQSKKRPFQRPTLFMVPHGGLKPTAWFLGTERGKFYHSVNQIRQNHPTCI